VLSESIKVYRELEH